MIEVKFDPDNGPDCILAVQMDRIVTAGDVDYFYKSLTISLDAVRSGYFPLRVLIDLSSTVMISDICMVRSLLQLQHIFCDGDRVAMLAFDMDHKMRLRQFYRNIDVAIFCSRLPAEMWLVSDMARPYQVEADSSGAAAVGLSSKTW